MAVTYPLVRNMKVAIEWTRMDTDIMISDWWTRGIVQCISMEGHVLPCWTKTWPSIEIHWRRRQLYTNQKNIVQCVSMEGHVLPVLPQTWPSIEIHWRLHQLYTNHKAHTFTIIIGIRSGVLQTTIPSVKREITHSEYRIRIPSTTYSSQKISFWLKCRVHRRVKVMVLIHHWGNRPNHLSNVGGYWVH